MMHVSTESFYVQVCYQKTKEQDKKLEKVTYICTSCTDLRLVFLKAMDVNKNTAD